MKSSLVRI